MEVGPAGRQEPAPLLEHRAAEGGWPPLEIHRSPRRRRGGQAVVREGRVVLRLPAGLPPAEEEAMVDALLGKVLRARARRQRGGDAALQRRAEELADRYLDGVRASSVRWSPRMRHRYGSCTVATGEIRISDRLALHPAYVLDYVLVHELAHLLVRRHDARFHALVDRYPEVARAQGYLEGYEAGRLAEASAVPDVADADPAPTTT